SDAGAGRGAGTGDSRGSCMGSSVILAVSPTRKGLQRPATADSLLRVAPYPPDARPVLAEVQRLHDAEAVALVQRHVPLLRALEVCRDALAITALQHRSHELCANAAPLVLWIDAEPEQVIVR